MGLETNKFVDTPFKSRFSFPTALKFSLLWDTLVFKTSYGALSSQCWTPGLRCPMWGLNSCTLGRSLMFVISPSSFGLPTEVYVLTRLLLFSSFLLISIISSSQCECVCVSLCFFFSILICKRGILLVSRLFSERFVLHVVVVLVFSWEKVSLCLFSLHSIPLLFAHLYIPSF